MRRKSPFVSLPGFVLLAFLFAGLALAVWLRGGRAFSPGALSNKSRPGFVVQGFDSHASFEQDCWRCHQPLKTRQAELCLACHEEIGRQIERGAGLHSALREVWRCFECHSDHRGRSFDPMRDALDDFDHSIASFDLIWHQADYDARPIDCAGCHRFDPQLATPASLCVECHAAQQVDFMALHLREFGEACLDCHDGKDRMARFDHSATDFPLDGRHAVARCADCHLAGRFESTPAECSQCHAEPAVHAGLFELECEGCHDSSAWRPALFEGEPFDHAVRSGFSLAKHARDYNGEAMTCLDCHGENIREFDLQYCETCHSSREAAFMQDHVSQFGPACLDCHDGVDRMSDFDHARVFPLEGRHAEISCESCHVERVFRGTPLECVRCHAEPQIHAGFFGLECQYCHTAEAWVPASLLQHAFPLDHGDEGEQACEVCHTETYDAYTCYGCHEHQPERIADSHAEEGVSAAELSDCAGCHLDGSSEIEDS